MSYCVTPSGKTPDTWSTRTSAWPCPIQAPCGHGLALLTLPLNAQLIMPRPYYLWCPPPGSLDSSGLREASPPSPSLTSTPTLFHCPCVTSWFSVQHPHPECPPGKEAPVGLLLGCTSPHSQAWHVVSARKILVQGMLGQRV